MTDENDESDEGFHRDRDESGRFASNFTDEELLRAVPRAGESPVATAGDVADALDSHRETVRNRLDKITGTNGLRSRRIGARARIWWIEDPTLADAIEEVEGGSEE